ncbi:MAG: HigA family addiction module antitoxin [Rubrobacteraceae bacterium]
MNERISEEVLRESRVRPPVHPGKVLEMEFLEPLGMTAYHLAKAIGVMPPRVYEIVRGARAVSADTALRLGRYFGTGPEFWLNLQSHYDLEVARDRAGDEIERDIIPLSKA